MKSTNRSGFSLIELIVVLAVATVLLGSSVSAVSARLSNNEATAADDFRTAHALTRATAVGRGQVAELHIDADASRFWVEVRDGGGSMTVVREFSVSEAVHFTSDRSVICFDARGLALTGSECQPGNLEATFSLGSAPGETVRTTLMGAIMD